MTDAVKDAGKSLHRPRLIRIGDHGLSILPSPVEGRHPLFRQPDTLF